MLLTLPILTQSRRAVGRSGGLPSTEQAAAQAARAATQEEGGRRRSMYKVLAAACEATRRFGPTICSGPSAGPHRLGARLRRGLLGILRGLPKRTSPPLTPS